NLQYKQPENNELSPTTATLTYTLAFTDLTPSVNPANNGSLSIGVDNVKLYNQAVISDASAGYVGSGGRTVVQVNTIVTVAQDIPAGSQVPVNTTALQNDSCPFLAIVNVPTPISFGFSNK